MCPGVPGQTRPDISPSSAPSANHWLLTLPLSLSGWGWAAAESSFCKRGEMSKTRARESINSRLLLCFVLKPDADVSPSWLHLERGRVPDEPIQGGEERVEAWPVPSVGLPALKHQRVEGRGAVVGGRETILVCYGLHHLQRERATHYR